MKIGNLHLLIILTAYISVPSRAAQQPVGKQNQQLSDANQKQFQNDPYFTLWVLQPTPGYKTLEAHVKHEKSTMKNYGYGLTPSKNWHLSLIAIAIPFPNKKQSQKYVQKAMDDLTKIVDSYEQDLTDVEFQFKEIKSLGTHKFLVASYERVGKKPFFSIYGDIVHDFLQDIQTAGCIMGMRWFRM